MTVLKPITIAWNNILNVNSWRPGVLVIAIQKVYEKITCLCLVYALFKFYLLLAAKMLKSPYFCLIMKPNIEVLNCRDLCWEVTTLATLMSNNKSHHSFLWCCIFPTISTMSEHPDAIQQSFARSWQKVGRDSRWLPAILCGTCHAYSPSALKEWTDIHLTEDNKSPWAQTRAGLSSAIAQFVICHLYEETLVRAIKG